jgi:hypothetical protein
MKNINPTFDELAAALKTLRTNGVRVTRSIRGGYDVTSLGQWRREGQTAADLIALAESLKPKEPATTSPQ